MRGRNDAIRVSATPYKLVINMGLIILLTKFADRNSYSQLMLALIFQVKTILIHLMNRIYFTYSP